MFRTSGFLALVALASTLAMSSLPAHAATISLSDASCPSFTATPDGQGNITITCGGGSGPPSGCSISGPTAGTVNQAITLSAVCSGGGAPTGWSWTGGNCQGVTTSVCAAVATSPSTVTYTMTASNGSGAAPAAQKTVTWSAGGSAPSGCSASASPSTLPVGGGQTTVTVTCSGGGAPTSYAWAAVPAVSGMQTTTATGSQTLSVTSSTTFSITPSNGSGAGNVAQVGVTVQTGGGGGYANCTAQGFTVVGNQTLTWGQNSNPNQAGPQENQVWVMSITPPVGTTPSNFFGQFQGAENGGTSNFQQMTVSTTPCDFATPLKMSNGTTTRIYYDVVGNGGFMQPGTTYYVNLRHWAIDWGTWSCSGSGCGNTVFYNNAPH